MNFMKGRKKVNDIAYIKVLSIMLVMTRCNLHDNNNLPVSDENYSEAGAYVSRRRRSLVQFASLTTRHWQTTQDILSQ